MRKPIIRLLSAAVFLLGLSGVYAVTHPQVATNFIGPGSFTEHVLAKLNLTDKVLCLALPDTPRPFDSLDKESLKTWITTLRYTTNPENLSVDEGPDNLPVLRQRFVPSDRGSQRVVASINLPESRTYEVEEAAFFEPGFDWGGVAESGKFGFGFAGGSAPTGGKVANDGFSARLMWKGDGNGGAHVGAYLYTVDRTQNLPYGDVFVFDDFSIPVGEWFRIKMRLTTNSAHEASDGGLTIWINDNEVFSRQNIQWQSEGEIPVIDQVLYSSFHGGDTVEWSPDETVYARFGDMCVFKERPDNAS